MSTLTLDFCRIDQLIQFDKTLIRSDMIQMQKQAIYQHRNRLLSTLLKQDITEQHLERTPYGKPYVKDQPNFYFNHSHSQNYYVLAASHRYKDLGVDIEELSRKVRFDALAQHAFHANELKKWQDSDFDPSYWFKVWTTKEAVLKAAGLGIRINLKEFDTQVHLMHDGGMCQHRQIGSFAYQNMQIGAVMLTVAWAAEASCKGFSFPNINLYSALTEH
jgi:4'-phosphopantetheinyl transferase